jgi:hypothetical protein
VRVNEADLDREAVDRGETGFRRKRLANAAGGDRLGCSPYELPPGERSWPFHHHTGNEEVIYVLAGTGTTRWSRAVTPPSRAAPTAPTASSTTATTPCDIRPSRR